MRFRVLEDEKRKNLFDAKPYWGASFPLDPRNANSLDYGICDSENKRGQWLSRPFEMIRPYQLSKEDG